MTYRTAPMLALALLLGGCSVDIGGFSFTREARVAAPAPAATASLPGGDAPRLQADGTCDRPTPAGGPEAVALGIGECDLVRIKGQPTDVLIGESGKGQREVQVLYSIPGAKEVYLFTDTKLTRIVQ